MNKMYDRLLFLAGISIFKTIYFNFVYFDLFVALHFPVLVFRRTLLKGMKGAVAIDCPVKPGLVTIGGGGIGILDPKFERTVWNVRGTVLIKGKVSIGKGSRISVGEKAFLTLEDGFNISGRTSIVCEKEIVFGKNVLLSWDILIMDSDFHYIYDSEGKWINPPAAISIGDSVWIGCKAVVLKGVSIANHVVVAANSVVTKDLIDERCIYGGFGNNMMILKKNLTWEVLRRNNPDCL